MIFIRKFFDDAAGGNSGGSPDATATADAKQTVTDPNAAAPPANLPQPVFTIEELKSLGVNSKEDAIAILNKVREDGKPDEEKKRQAAIEKADFLKYAAVRNYANDDFNKYESLTAKADRDLIFEKYAAEEKADNPDLTDSELKEAFESEYKLDSENEKVKAKGEARLKREAAEIRKPAENAWSTAQTNYKEELSALEKQKEFKALVKDTFKSNVPEKYTFKVKNGEEEVDVELDVTPELRKDIEKAFDSEKSFAKYLTYDGKEKEFVEAFKANVQSFIESKLAKAGVQKGVELGIKLGTKKGSNAGADNPFALQNNSSGNKDTKVVSLEESNSKIAKARRQYSNR